MSRQFLEYHPTIGYRFVPKLQARLPHETGGYLVRTNAQGFRCPHDFVAERTPGKRRVLLFGDSFTAGDGVSNGSRYSDVLETLHPEWEVYNLALPGTGTDQQFLVYREYAQGIDHDVMVLAVLVENIRRVAAHYRHGTDPSGQTLCYAKPYYTLDGTKLVLHQVPVPKDPVPETKLSEGAKVDQGGRFPLLRKIVTDIGAKDLVQRLSGYQPLPEYDDPQNADWRVMRTILLEWIRGHAKPVILMPLPLYHYTEQLSDPSAYQARFRELADEAGCALHDPLPDLWRASPEARRAYRFAKDIHPTPAGHDAIARSLARVIETRLSP